MFGKKKDHDHAEIKSDIADLKLEVEKLKTQIISLRASFNSRLGKTIEPSETLKNTDGLDGLRIP